MTFRGFDSSSSDKDEIEEMTNAMGDMVVGMLVKATGPISDLIRSSTSATIDAVIDARRRLLDEGWPEAMADLMVITIVNRNADVASKVAQTIQSKQSGGSK